MDIPSYQVLFRYERHELVQMARALGLEPPTNAPKNKLVRAIREKILSNNQSS
jgi:hypothetical protein